MAVRASAARSCLVRLSLRRARRRAALLSATSDRPAPEGDGDGLARLAERDRSVLDSNPLLLGETLEERLMGADMSDDDLELARYVLDRPVGGTGGEHGLALFSQVIRVDTQLGKV